MAEKFDQDELVSLRELLIANSIQIDAMVMLLIEKGLIAKDEFFATLKQVQMKYKSKDNA